MIISLMYSSLHSSVRRDEGKSVRRTGSQSNGPLRGRGVCHQMAIDLVALLFADDCSAVASNPIHYDVENDIHGDVDRALSR